LESLTIVLWRLADARLGAATIIANFHHRRVVPLMERELCIFEMSDTANPVTLARSRLLQERFPKEYAATRVRRAVSVTPDFTRKTGCISYVHQDQNYTHMIDKRV
jgi:hypothetical protein